MTLFARISSSLFHCERAKRASKNFDPFFEKKYADYSALNLPKEDILSILLPNYEVIVIYLYCERAKRVSRNFDTSLKKYTEHSALNLPKEDILSILLPYYEVIVIYCERAKRASKKFDTFLI